MTAFALILFLLPALLIVAGQAGLLRSQAPANLCLLYTSDAADE